MTVSEVLETAWNALAVDIRSDPGIYERRIFANSQHSLFVGLSHPARFSQLILGISPKSLRGRLDLETKGFRLHVEKFGNPVLVRVRLEETSRAFGDLFKHLCADVVTAVLATTSEQLAVDALCTRLSRWQKFLEEAAAGLSELAQVGLYGELYFLRRLLLGGCPPRKALDGWQGPLGANHDFMFGYSAVEVKSTTANTDTVLLIANERQLDDTGVSSLILCSCSFDRREHTAQTLPAIIEEVGQMLGLDLLSPFEDRLLAVGYHRSHNALYATAGYAERRMAYYQVSDSFPRIVPKDLRPGVHEVQYHTELAAATGLMIPESTVFAALI
jgi:hypothetical protein